jgi:Prokaryotic N-terminal methylation motif
VKISDEKGITLVELLATMTVLMIVMPVIYGVFSTGFNLYNKIQVEGQLRDDADYSVTMVMNSLYSFPFDYVKSCGTNCIELVDNTSTQIENVEGQSFYTIQQNKQLDAETSIQIKIIEKSDEGKSINVFEIDGKILETNSNFEHSTISYSCTNFLDSAELQCKSAMIDLDLVLSNERLEDPFRLESQFGF